MTCVTGVIFIHFIHHSLWVFGMDSILYRYLFVKKNRKGHWIDWFLCVINFVFSVFFLSIFDDCFIAQYWNITSKFMQFIFPLFEMFFDDCFYWINNLFIIILITELWMAGWAKAFIIKTEAVSDQKTIND